MLNKFRALAHHPIGQLVLAYLAGGFTALAFAPYDLWPVYFIALTFVLHQSQNLSAKSAFGYWLSFGFGCFSVGISWVHVSMDHFGGLPLIASLGLMALLALYLGLYAGLTGYLLQKIAPHSGILRNLLLFPALWTLTEWARGWVLTGFPWLWAGYSQTQGPLKMLASVIGTLGLSFVIALLCGALALCIQKRWKSIVILLPITALCTILVINTSHITPTNKDVNVVLVQGNIPQSMKWEPEALWPTMLKYMDLTRPQFNPVNKEFNPENKASTTEDPSTQVDDNKKAPMGVGADLIIWPEAAIPAPEYLVEDFLSNANRVANLNNSAILTGIISQQGGDFYNSLIVLGNHDNKQQKEADYQGNGINEYKKHHLLPIGEFVPFESLLRPIAPFFNLPMSSFARGDYRQPNLNALGYNILPAICYEIAFPEQVRANFNNDTNLLLTISNDAWFGRSNGPLQHMEIAQMRAVELGRPLLRATNTGVTAIVDEKGNITKELPQFETGVLTAKVPLFTGLTPFAKWGEWPVLFLSGLFFVIALIFRIKQK
ncbi:apolipoprotein N-acyltransferase [Shewanella surugensis]|uniref:Apolipoprotein N-acyltransferase n=1 Tax=Shewanella surugensis TaxID=212020 RepID=A0ABT0L814_9GAMM|nr:apolipoprotein N-acyltransferase [Shewanella surugensis]MCL1123821.1 apolipoprotein N-acyltransferase [Shewanella surugensis]